MVAMGKHRADIIRDAQAFVADSGTVRRPVGRVGGAFFEGDSASSW